MSDRATEKREAKILSVPMAASVTIEAGKMVCANASGYAVPAADTANFTMIGVAEETKTNDGSDGAESVLVRRLMAFKMDNAGSGGVTQASLGKDVYVKDAATVAASGVTNSIVAGKCVGLASDGVWVWIA